jgi:hypothetical protein
MKTNNYLFLLTILFMAACSSGVKISSNHEEDINFNEYSTFKVLPVEYETTERLQYSEDNKKIIKEAIINELKAMNFTEDDSNPDVLMYATVTIEKEAQMRERTFQDGPAYTGQRNYSWSASDSILVGYYDEGSLVVNMIDAKKNHLVWHATARKALKDKAEEDRETKLRQAVSDMFDEYPGNPNPPTSMK